METSRIISIGHISGLLPGWGVTPLRLGPTTLAVYRNLYRVTQTLGTGT